MNSRRGVRWWCQLPTTHLDDERYLELSFSARGLLADIYRVADRAGRFRAGLRALARAVGGSINDAEFVDAWEELTASRMLEVYEVDGVRYGELSDYADTIGEIQKGRRPSDLPAKTLDAMRSGPSRDLSGPSRDLSGPSRDVSGLGRDMSAPSRDMSGRSRDLEDSDEALNAARDEVRTRSGPSRDISGLGRDTKYKEVFQTSPRVRARGGFQETALTAEQQEERLRRQRQALQSVVAVAGLADA